MNDPHTQRALQGVEPSSLQRRMSLTSEISYFLQAYGAEATRTEPSLAYLEAHASRVLRLAAALYACSLKPATGTWYADGTLDTASAEIVDIWCGRKD